MCADVQRRDRGVAARPAGSRSPARRAGRAGRCRAEPRPSTSGPSGARWPRTARRPTASVSPEVDVAPGQSRARAPRRRSAAKVGRLEVGPLEDAVDHRADQGAPGHVGQTAGRRARAPRPAASAPPRGTTGAPGTSSSDVQRRSGSLPTAGWSCRPRVMPSTTSGASAVERPVEDGGLELAAASPASHVASAPPAAGRPARPPRRGPSAASGRLDLVVAAHVARRRAPTTPVGVAVEEQPGERRVLAVHGAGPPHDGLVAGPGQGDVEQAQVLAPPSSSSSFWWAAKLVALVRRRRWCAGCPLSGRGRRARPIVEVRPSHRYGQ